MKRLVKFISKSLFFFLVSSVISLTISCSETNDNACIEEEAATAVFENLLNSTQVHSQNNATDGSVL